MLMNTFQTLQAAISRILGDTTGVPLLERVLDKTRLRSLGLFDWSTLLYLGFWVLLLIWRRTSLPHFPVYLGLALWLMVLIVGLANFPFRSEVGRFLRYAYLMFYVIIFFSSMHYLVPLLNPHSVDARLILLDLRMFGLHPVVYLQRFYHPWLTEYLQYCYSTYYFIPVVLGVYLYFKRDFRRLDVTLLAISLGFYLSYLGYLLFPALGPRFFLAHLFTRPLEGVAFFEGIQNLLNNLENIQYDAFPSGHTAVVIVAVFYAWRYARPLFWVFLPIGISLIFSTVYLRYHYVVDVLGGWVVALLAIGITEWAAARWRGPADGRAQASSGER